MDGCLFLCFGSSGNARVAALGAQCIGAGDMLPAVLQARRLGTNFARTIVAAICNTSRLDGDI